MASVRKEYQVYIGKNVPVYRWLNKKFMVYGHILVGIQKPFRSDIKDNVSALYMSRVYVATHGVLVS